ALDPAGAQRTAAGHSVPDRAARHLPQGNRLDSALEAGTLDGSYGSGPLRSGGWCDPVKPGAGTRVNTRRLISIILKELRQLRRDPRLLRVLLIAPIVQLVFFGYAISTDLKDVRLGVILEDSSPE